MKRVLPKEDDTCPGCGVSMDEAAAPTGCELVSIHARTKFPGVCFRCGNSPASEHVMVKIMGKASTEQVAGRFVLLRIFGFLFGSGAASRASSGVNIAADSFRIDLPACLECRKTPVEAFLRESSLSQRTIRIVAHSTFAAGLKTGL